MKLSSAKSYLRAQGSCALQSEVEAGEPRDRTYVTKGTSRSCLSTRRVSLRESFHARRRFQLTEGESHDRHKQRDSG
jgi:hypothetical protein